jgi:protein-L-isoaspartate(D-aspartate) O-methyltransferase
MVIPVGPPGIQELLLITKDQAGEINRQSVGEVRFVEMKGKYGWSGR